VFIWVPCRRAQNRAERYRAHFDRVTLKFSGTQPEILAQSRGFRLGYENWNRRSRQGRRGLRVVARYTRFCARDCDRRPDPGRAKAVAADLRYGAPLCPEVALRDGDYAELAAPTS